MYSFSCEEGKRKGGEVVSSVNLLSFMNTKPKFCTFVYALSAHLFYFLYLPSNTFLH